MFARALVVLILMWVAPLGCSDGPTGPASGIDPSLVGTWVSRARATDENGVFLCTYVAMRLVLRDTGRFDWNTVDAPPGDVCEATTFRRDSGVWGTHDGAIAFAPPPMEVEGTTLELPYELEGDELHVGAIVFERP